MQEIEKAELNLSVGVTAHRDLQEAEVPDIEVSVGAFFDKLEREFPDIPLQLITPLAEGGDQLAARVAISHGISIVAVLPMEQVEYEKDFVTEKALSEFRGLLVQADQVITLPPPRNATDLSQGESQRQRQYAQLGLFVSNHCQVLLALWDGKDSEEPGGTGQVVKYHLTAVMKGVEDDPTPASLLAENENDLVYHIVCSRDRPGGGSAAGLNALESAWFSSRMDGERSTDIPEAYRTLLSRLQQFSRDWHEKSEIIRERSFSLLAGKPELELPTGARLTDQLFQVADGLAIHYQKRVHSSLRAVHILAVLMGLVFLVYSEYDGPRYMIMVFLGLFFAGVALHIIGESREWHRKYLDYRALAEGLRVQFYWNLSGVADMGYAGFAFDNFLQTQDVDLGWIRHVMRQASMFCLRGQSHETGWVAWVIDEWVGDPVRGRGQLAYYSSKELDNISRFRRTRVLGNLCLWAGIVIAIVLFLMGADGGEEQRRNLFILMGVLPLVAGIWDAYSHKKAEKELIKQYGFMNRVFLKARKLLVESDDIFFQRQVLNALGQAALDEGAEWLLMHRERPLEHGRL